MAKIDEFSASRKGAYAFAEDEWLSFDRALEPIDGILRSLASNYGMHWQAHAPKGWPGRTLKRRRLLQTYLLRISLNPDYVNSGRVTWDIVDLWMYDYGELVNKTVSYQILAVCTELSPVATESIIVSAVAAALS